MLVVSITEPGPVNSAMQSVVDPLRDRKKLRVTIQHQPAGIHPGTTAVSQQRLQHLRHTTTLSSGVDIPYHPISQQPPTGGSRRYQVVRLLLTEQPAERIKGRGLYLDLLHCVIQHFLVTM